MRGRAGERTRAAGPDRDRPPGAAPRALAAALLGAALCAASPAEAQNDGTVTNAVRIGSAQVPLAGGAEFGRGIARLGDLNGDGVPDLAVGAPGDDAGGADAGSVRILFLAANGTVVSSRAIDATSESPPLPLAAGDRFGHAVAALHDLDNDGVVDLLVGAPGDDTGATDAGAAWILFLRADGSVRSWRKMAAGDNGPSVAELSAGDAFGSAVAGMMDLDGNGVPELAVGAPGTDGYGTDRGAAWLFRMNADGTFAVKLRIGDSGSAGFGSVPPANPLADGDRLGASLASPGDLNGDRNPDLLIGAPGVDGGGADRGGIWAVTFWSGGVVRAKHRIELGAGLADFDAFGAALGLPGDVDGDGLLDALAGAPGDDGEGAGAAAERGAAWLAFLDALEQATAELRIGDGDGGFPAGTLSDGDRFGAALAGVGDLDGDGASEIAVGAPGSGAGAVWILTLDRAPAVCGDGVLDPDEDCDESDLNYDWRRCKADCSLAWCGDGVQNRVQEQCDDGPANSDTTPDACRLGCIDPVCGDGVIDPGLGEECDDGPANSDTEPGACRLDCTLRPETVLFRHEGGLGPTYEEWTFEPGNSGPVSYVSLAPEAAYGNRASWMIDDDGTGAGSTLVYTRAPSAAQLGVAAAEGWTLRGVVRVADAPDALDRSVALEFADGARRWVLALGADAAGNPVALLWDGAPGNGGAQVALTGGGYREYELVHDPVAGSADLFVDGVERLSDYAGFADGGVPARVAWGSQDGPGTGRGHYHLVEWGLNRVCGNGAIDTGESCDDANVENGDGCDAACLPEPGWSCGLSYGTTFCAEVCGDGVVTGAEECEDGNTAAGDGCGPTCQTEGFGSILRHDRIDTAPFDGYLYGNSENLGMAVAPVGDVDGDGVEDLAATTRGHLYTLQPDGSDLYEWHRGAVWILFLNPDRTVRDTQKIFHLTGGLGALDPGDTFGESIAGIGDLDGDGVPDLLAGAHADDDAGSDAGALYVLFLNADGTVKSTTKIREGAAGFDDPAISLRHFGREIAPLGDVDGDGRLDVVATGWPPPSAQNQGAGHLYVLHLENDGTVASWDRIDHAGTPIGAGDQSPVGFFGRQLATVGDLDGDGIPELAVGVDESLAGAPDGAVWIYFLDAAFGVREVTRVNAQVGGFVPDYRDDSFDFFALSLAGVGDLDGDGIPDLAVGAAAADVQAHGDGSAWIWFLNADGTVRDQRTINFREGGLDIPVVDEYNFASSLAGLPDLDGDGVSELAAGSIYDSVVGFRQGAIWILHPLGVPAACGDGALAPGEECDDGGSVPGDGCSAGCEVEDALDLFGVAAGGSVEVAVNGVRVSVPTAPGASAADVAAALAAALAAEPALAAAGLEVAASGAHLATSGVVTLVGIDDFGLSNCAAPPAPAIAGAGANVCPATTTPLAATAGAAGYRWYRGATPIAGAAGAGYDAALSGTYRVRATDAAGCQGFSAPAAVTVAFCPESEVAPPGALFPLRVEKSASSSTGYFVRFQSLDGVDGYHVYSGSLGNWYSHGGGAEDVCDAPVATAGDGEVRAELPPAGGSRYYLVAAYAAGVEGPAGRDSAGSEIPPALSTCSP